MVHCKSHPVYSCQPPPSPSHSLHLLPLLEIGKKRAILGGKRSWQAETAAPVNLGVVGADLVFSTTNYHPISLGSSGLRSVGRSVAHHFSILEECDVVRDLEALSLGSAEGAKGRAKPITANREKSSQDKNCIPARRDAEENREDAARGPQGFLNRVA